MISFLNYFDFYFRLVLETEIALHICKPFFYGILASCVFSFIVANSKAISLVHLAVADVI